MAVMDADGLPLPQGLLNAIASGRWPRSGEESGKQELMRLFPKDRIQRLAPDEDRVYLYPPPFHTVARVLRDDTFYRRFGAIEQIDPALTVEIGDFGLGSDAPIALDYRNTQESPQVIRLRWPGGGLPNQWEVMSPDFDSFARTLGL